jgi:hypothetical protein
VTKVNYQDERSEVQRIRDRLKPSSGGLLDEWPANSTTTTMPTRTISSVYHSSTQQGPTVSGQPRGSRPRDVGVGIFDTNEDRFNATYGINQKPKGLTLSPFALRRKG